MLRAWSAGHALDVRPRAADQVAIHLVAVQRREDSLHEIGTPPAEDAAVTALHDPAAVRMSKPKRPWGSTVVLRLAGRDLGARVGSGTGTTTASSAEATAIGAVDTGRATAMTVLVSARTRETAPITV